jgi:hypothetical protein
MGHLTSADRPSERARFNAVLDNPGDDGWSKDTDAPNCAPALHIGEIAVGGNARNRERPPHLTRTEDRCLAETPTSIDRYAIEALDPGISKPDSDQNALVG